MNQRLTKKHENMHFRVNTIEILISIHISQGTGLFQKTRQEIVAVEYTENNPDNQVIEEIAPGFLFKGEIPVMRSIMQ
jgi:hypothetical protein